MTNTTKPTLMILSNEVPDDDLRYADTEYGQCVSSLHELGGLVQEEGDE